MKFSTAFTAAALLALLGGSSVDARPSPRAAYPTMSASNIKSYSLWGWGPQEKSSNTDMVILDGDIESAGTIKNLRSQGVFVTCYLSAGTLENWRADAKKFTAATESLAKKYKGFGGTETWFDITAWEELKAPMTSRIDAYASKGCQAIEFDNIDCYNNMCVAGASYQTLMQKQVEYVSWLADTAHARGMAVGMKNAVELIPKLLSKMQFAVNEECQEYGSPKGAECKLYNQFTSSNKPVFGVEYDNNGGNVCSVAKSNKMLTKYRSGGSWFNCF